MYGGIETGYAYPGGDNYNADTVVHNWISVPVNVQYIFVTPSLLKR